MICHRNTNVNECLQACIKHTAAAMQKNVQYINNCIYNINLNLHSIKTSTNCTWHHANKICTSITFQITAESAPGVFTRRQKRQAEYVGLEKVIETQRPCFYQAVHKVQRDLAPGRRNFYCFSVNSKEWKKKAQQLCSHRVKYHNS